MARIAACVFERRREPAGPACASPSVAADAARDLCSETSSCPLTVFLRRSLYSFASIFHCRFAGLAMAVTPARPASHSSGSREVALQDRRFAARNLVLVPLHLASR